jgi:hypothetical protein
VEVSGTADREVGAEVIGTADRISWAEQADVAGAAVTRSAVATDCACEVVTRSPVAAAVGSGVSVEVIGTADRVA